MAYNFSDEDKAATSDFQDRIPFGVHEVQFVGASAGETEANKDYIDVTVADASGVEERVRVWFTGGASPYSFQTLRQIAVHTAKTDDAKEKARMAVENTKNTDELANLLNKNCVGGSLWFTKYYDPSRTYDSNGQTRRSINTNVYGYEPKPKPELMPSDAENVQKTFPGAKPDDAEAAGSVPPDSAWK